MDQPTSSSRTQLRRVRKWQSDDEYIAAQDSESTWSSKSDWGKAAAKKFIEFGRSLTATGQLFHDDKVADFGGNDGYAANEFYKAHAIKPLVVDCEPKRIDHAMKVYGLSTYEAFIEDMRDLESKSIDWGFCSHTLEHTRDTRKALREIARVVRRGCLFILPIEDDEHVKVNPAHACNANSLREWRDVVKANGWKVVNSARPIRQECYIMAIPK